MRSLQFILHSYEHFCFDVESVSTFMMHIDARVVIGRPN